MKKITYLFLALFAVYSYGQKKKSTPKNAPVATSKVISTAGNASVELDKNKLFLFVKNGTKKDTLLLKTYIDKPIIPTDCKITSFTTKGTAMYYLAWNEKSLIDTKLKKEETTTIESQIWNPATKVLLVSNSEATSNITEIVFLDRLKTASETQQRVKRSGYTFIFNNNGDYSLQTKSGATKYTYNPTTLKYEVDKGTPAATPPPAKKKRR